MFHGHAQAGWEFFFPLDYVEKGDNTLALLFLRSLQNVTENTTVNVGYAFFLV